MFKLLVLMTAFLNGAASSLAGLSVAANTQRSYSEWESVDPKSPEFLTALMELQKIHYAQERWDRFFAYGLFYRDQFLQGSEGSKNPFHSKLISLEALALGKLCHWEAALGVVGSGLEIAKKMGITDQISEFETTLALLKIQRQYPQLKSTKTGSEIPSSVFSTSQYWQMSHKRMKQISHPKFLRMKIDKGC